MEQSFSSRISYVSDLNPPQLSAVTTESGPVLVIAGAGSGKTRTIVYRVAWLVEKNIEPESILLLTFTRKASQEMLTRAARLLDIRAQQVAGGTFHSIGNMLLRRYGASIGIQQSFTIMDQGDSTDAIDHVKSSISLTKEENKSFPKTRTVAEVISRATGTQRRIEEILEKRHPQFLQFSDSLNAIRRLYEDHKRRNNLVDYDDLLVLTIRLLTENEEIRRKVSNHWQYVLVDEYQDTNRLQAQIVKLLAYTHDNVMVVGDDSQSIYSFRGADFLNIMEFPQLFPGTKIVKLEENYRSSTAILKVTNSIIERAAVGFPKTLFSKNTTGPLPMAVRAETERDQSRFVIKCIEELKYHGLPLNEISVLFRAGFHSFDLESELTRNGFPFVKFGGMKFMEAGHIKDVLAHLKVIANFQDHLSWIRIFKLLPGVGPKKALKLAASVCDNGIPENPAKLAEPKFRTEFISLIELLKEIRSSESAGLAEKIDKVNRHYFPFLQQKYDNYPKKMRELDQLADMALSYRSLTSFLNDVALEPPDSETSVGEYGSESLVLSTIHSAKGLEWHTVILLWAAEGRIPSPMSIFSPDDLEEERRLLYVATTRAKHNLVITAPRTFFDRTRGVVQVKFSRFFEEIPQDYFRFHNF